jgi:hypothetical protein
LHVPISTGAGKHLVDAENVEWVGSHADVEAILSGNLGDVLVDANTGSLKSLRRDHFTLEGDEVNTGGELIDGGLLLAQVVDADSGVGDTTTESGLGVRLVLNVTVAVIFANAMR